MFMRFTSNTVNAPKSAVIDVHYTARGGLRGGWFTESVAWRLLLLSACGPAFGNVLVFWLGDFAVTLSHLLLFLAIAAVSQQKRQHYEFRFVFPILMMLMLDGYHALVSGYIGEVEWQKSYAQFLVYSACFIFLVGFRPSKEAMAKIAPWIMKLGIALGGVGILQFTLLLFGISTRIPEPLSVKTIDFTESVWRYGGFIPATGLAAEPSYYSLGLVTLLAYLLFLNNIYLINEKSRLFWVSLVVLLGGILVSFSLTGILMVGLVLLGWLGIQGRLRQVITVFSVVIIIGIVISRIGVMAPIQDRLLSAIVGADNSAQIRVAAASKLLFAGSTSFESFVFGAGLGMEVRELDTYLNVYREASLRSFVQDEVKIHNILTTVRFFQGWIGVAFYGLLVGAILLPGSGRLRGFFPMALFFALYHFASGLYLHPAFWSLLALMAISRRIQLESRTSGVTNLK